MKESNSAFTTTTGYRSRTPEHRVCSGFPTDPVTSTIRSITSQEVKTEGSSVNMEEGRGKLRFRLPSHWKRASNLRCQPSETPVRRVLRFDSQFQQGGCQGQACRVEEQLHDRWLRHPIIPTRMGRAVRFPLLEGCVYHRAFTPIFRKAANFDPVRRRSRVVEAIRC